MPSPFSGDYFTARQRFRQAVADAGGRLTSLALAARGPDGEVLTIEIGWFGPDNPARAILHASGVHGVEAFAGSAIQLQWLADGLDLPSDCAAVIVHVVDPYGMAWGRRVNARNVDLNRNCLGPGDPYAGAPEGYAALNDFVNPSGAAPDAWFHVRAAWLACRHGLPALRQAIAGGQYANPKGLFFGGSSLEEEPRLLRELLCSRLPGVRRLVGIDVHTGLGPFARDTLFVNDPPDSPAFGALSGACGRIVSPDPRRPSGYRARGTFDAIVRQALPGAQVLFVVQEFGTYSPLPVFRALRLENWRFHHRGGGNKATGTGELVPIFSPGDAAWRAAVLDRGRALIEGAIRLAGGE